MCVIDIISLCGTNTFHRRKIFEHKEVLKQLIDFVDITKSFKVTNYESIIYSVK